MGGLAYSVLDQLVMLPVAFAIHRYLEETPEFKKIAEKLEQAPAARRSPVFEVLRKNPGTVLMAAGSNAIGVIFFYTMITGSVQYATTYLGLERSTVLTFILIACLLQIPLVPLFGYLSDRVGRKLIFGVGTVAMMVWGGLPMWLLIGASGPGTVWPFAVAVIVGVVAMSFQTGTQARCSPSCSRPRCASPEHRSVTRSPRSSVVSLR